MRLYSRTSSHPTKVLRRQNRLETLDAKRMAVNGHHTEHLEVTMDRQGLPLKQVLRIEINVLVSEQGGDKADSHPKASGDFETSYKVTLRKTLAGNKRIYDIVVDTTSFGITERQYSFLKALIDQMQKDARDGSRAPSGMGWVTKETLASETGPGTSLQKSGESARFADHELARGVYDLRNKFAAHGVSRKLVDTGLRGSTSYRISTAPGNLRLVLP